MRRAFAALLAALLLFAPTTAYGDETASDFDDEVVNPFDDSVHAGWVIEDGIIYWFDAESGSVAADGEQTITGLCAPIAAASGSSSFTDVSSETAHAEDIAWLFGSGISTGWVAADGARTFRPLTMLARADMAAFLYRLAGSPTYVPTVVDATYFSDVTPDTPHAREIWWLASEGISKGWETASGHEFRPYASLARCDMAAFLYRLADSPAFEPSDDEAGTFADVSWNSSHAKEVWWLASTGISEGWRDSDGVRTYRPLAQLARSDMAAFLHRMIAGGVFTPAAEHIYRFAQDGSLVTGWLDVSLFDATTGARVDAGWGTDGSCTYFIDPDSRLPLAGGLHDIAGSTYLFSDDGELLYGWNEVDGSRRYFSVASGFMYTDGTFKIGNDTYCFASDGSLVTGLVNIGGYSYYFDPASGRMLTGFVMVDGVRRYFEPMHGRLFTSGNAELDAILFSMIDRFGMDGVNSLRAMYDWISDKSAFSYRHMDEYPPGTWQSWSVPYAIHIYRNHYGNCYYFASLLCWGARALGYDAQAVSGEVLTSSGWEAHSWAEIALPSGAVIIDVTEHRADASRNYFMVDYDHAPLYYRKV